MKSEYLIILKKIQVDRKSFQIIANLYDILLQQLLSLLNIILDHLSKRAQCDRDSFVEYRIFIT